MIQCPKCGVANAPGSFVCSACGIQLQQGDATGGVIPYKNPKALIAYYLGFASGLPFIGLVFGIPAVILGVMGLIDRNKNPAIKGSVHAGIGIGCGTLFTIVWGIMVVGILMAIAAG